MMRGIMKINLAKFFTWTGAFLIIIAAGVLSYGLHDLQEANILPGLNNVVFESYKYIDPGSFLGTMLKAVFNLSSTTTWIEAIAWVLYVSIIMTLFFRVQLRHRRVRQSSAPKNVAAAANSTPENGGTTTTQPLSNGTP